MRYTAQRQINRNPANHAAYIASWLKVLKNDKRAIFTAASHAQRAADFLHHFQPANGRIETERVAV
jgi:antirestriction protein ArdC